MTCKCGKPTRDNAVVCDNCCARLTQALAEVPFLIDQLDITIARETAAPITGSSPSAERGIHWNDRAANAKRGLHNTLVLWVRLCADENVRRVGGKDTLPIDETRALSRWLICRVDGLRFHDAGSDAVDEITQATGEARRIVFWKQKNRDYLGPCEQAVTNDDGETLTESCPGEVYAEEGAAVGHCDECGQGVTVVIRKAELNTRLDSHLCTPAEIATFAVYLGLPVKRDAVRRKVNHWSEHGRIEQRGVTPTGDPIFRYGEVRPLLYAHFAEKVKS